LHAHASPDSSPVPPEDTSEPNTSTPERAPVNDFQIVYTHRQKVPASESVPVHLSKVDGPPIQPSASYSDLDIPIVLRKGKQPCMIIQFQILFPMIILTHSFVSLPYPYLLSLYPSLVRKLY